MDSTTTGALRVVLDVTEVSAVAEMERMRANTERMMKTYHFRESMKQWLHRFLCVVNRHGPYEDNVADNPGGLWYRVELDLPHWFAVNKPDCVVTVVGYHDGFAAGDITVDATRMRVHMVVFDRHVVELDNLDIMTDCFDAHPGLYDAFMDTINPDYFDHMIATADYYLPNDGCICVNN